jgi:hypothetical protein
MLCSQVKQTLMLMGEKPAVHADRHWRLWTAALPCGLAVTVSGLLVIGDGLAGVMASWDTPSPGIGWIRVAIIGHCTLAAASLVLLGLAARPSSRHRGEAIAAWAIIVAAIAWFVLAGRLASGSL